MELSSLFPKLLKITVNNVVSEIVERYYSSN
jgi:hypothetical protein